MMQTTQPQFTAPSEAKVSEVESSLSAVMSRLDEIVGVVSLLERRVAVVSLCRANGASSQAAPIAPVPSCSPLESRISDIYDRAKSIHDRLDVIVSELRI